MKGLLHRLAARATGTAVPIRSDARLPFGESSLGRHSSADIPQAFEEAPTIDTSAPPSQVPTATRTDSQSTSPRRTIDRSSQDPPASREHAHVTTIVEAHAPPPATARPAERTVTQPPGERTFPPGLPLPLVDSELTATANVVTSHEPTSSRSSALRQREPPVPTEAPRTSSEPSLLLPAEGSDLPTFRTVTPYLGPLTQQMSSLTSHMSPRQPTGRISMPQTPSNEQATEVHIHIGRIDVSSVREAAPPRRKAPAKPEPVSLDAYLAKRGRT